jgi:hypothetical protein
MPCDILIQLEKSWRERYEAAKYYRMIQHLDLPPAEKKTQVLIMRECLTQQARVAQAMIAHQKECDLCNNLQGELPIAS